MTAKTHVVEWPFAARMRTTATRRGPTLPGHSAPSPTRSPDGLLTITTDVARGRITLSGELDFATAPALDEPTRIVVSGPAQRITLDLTELHFIDAAGLGHLVRLRTTLTAAGRELTLRRPSRGIVRTFAAGGLCELLEPDR